MRKFLLLLFFILLVPLSSVASEFPQGLKETLKHKFPDINFKIDNSFVINNYTFLPLVPKVTKKPDKLAILDIIPNESEQKLIILSNDWIFVKVLKQGDGNQSILELKEVPDKYKSLFLSSKFPEDLVVPKNLVLEKELSGLIGDLPISIHTNEKDDKIEKLNGTLYLTSPDTGKIIYVNLNNLKKINYIQTGGSPWALTYNKTNKMLLVTDFAKDIIYELKPSGQTITKRINLPVMSSPKDLESSDTDSTIYVIESLGNSLGIYSDQEDTYTTKTKLPINPTNLALLKEKNLIAVTCPSVNSIVFLNTTDYSVIDQIMIEGGPENIISNRKGTIVYTVNRNGNTVSEIDVETRKIKNTFSVEETPVSIALHPNEKLLYVGNGKSNSISIIDLIFKKSVGTIKLPPETQFPSDIKITDDGLWLIATSETTDKISIIDLENKEIALKLDVGSTTHSAYIISKGLNIESDKP